MVDVFKNWGTIRSLSFSFSVNDSLLVFISQKFLWRFAANIDA